MKSTIKKIKSKSELTSFLKKSGANHDIFKKLQFELFVNTHPKQYFSDKDTQKKAFNEFYKELIAEKEDYQLGNWVNLPWVNKSYHLPSSEDYYKLRTMRNLFLVSKKDQEELRSKKIAIAGLSLGKGVLLALIRYGIGSNFHIADNDVLEISNMNRADYYLTDYLQPKVNLTEQAAFQIDPYLKIKTFTDGLTEDNIDDFIFGADLLIDTFDSFPLKLLLRKKAAENKIPVISGVDLEKGILMIIERYDTDPNLSMDVFLNNLDPSLLAKKNITKTDVTQFFIDLIGEDLHSEKMLKSVLSVGTDLTSYPQLIIASMLFSSMITLVAESILLGKDTPSGRVHIDLSSFLSKIK